MNIIKSKFSLQELFDFRNAERKRVGKENCEFVYKTERNCCITALSLLSLLVVSLVLVPFWTNTTWAEHFIQVLHLIPMILVFIVFRVGEFGLFKITLRKIKKKQIPMSPIYGYHFSTLLSKFTKLTKLSDCLDKSPNATFRVYQGDGAVIVSYLSPTGQIEVEVFYLGPTLARTVWKNDILDFSIYDKSIERVLSQIGKEE